MEKVSGKDLTQFKRWYSQAGTPRLTIERVFNESDNSLTLKAVQSTAPSADESAKEPFVIPVELGLLDAQGNVLELHTEDESFDAARGVWVIHGEQQEIRFDQVAQGTVVSLLRDFSAPVLLTDDLTDDERVVLIGSDPNGFNRWEQCQSIYKKLITQKVQADFDYQLLDRLVGSLNQLLQSDVEDAVKAELLKLPAESEFLQLVPHINILSVAKARDALKSALAKQLKSSLADLFESISPDSDYRFQADQVGLRKLKNEVLELLLIADSETYKAVALAQYDTASNMTDQLAAFKLLMKYADLNAANIVSDRFLVQWKDDVQVLEQWFRVQVSRSDEQTLERVNALLEHQLFEYQNPNKVRAVIGSFAMMNVESFHAADGSGYEFLSKQVAKIDAMNPQIAARLVGPLVKWQSYDSVRGEQMKAQLDVLAKGDLSKDLFEVVSKSLN